MKLVVRPGTEGRVAHDIQLRAAIELAKMYGLYPRKGQDESDSSPGEGTRIVVNLGFLGSERAAEVLRRAQERLRGTERGLPDMDVPLKDDPER